MTGGPTRRPQGRVLFVIIVSVLVVNSPQAQQAARPLGEAAPSVVERVVEPVPREIPVPPRERPPVEKSDFERYVSPTTVITDAQFEVLTRFRNLTFSYEETPLSPGMIMVPITVTRKTPEETLTENAGFLIGTPQAIQTAFELLEIKSPLIVSRHIKQFGYDFFERAPFAPAANLPVTPGYVIGPGDEIRINVWGNVEGQWNVTVDRDGNIDLPTVGVIGVTGLTFEEAKGRIDEAFSKYYTGFDMNVSLGLSLIHISEPTRPY